MIGDKLAINAQGLVQSQRMRKDGCTIIGCQEQNAVTGEHYNDFVIRNEMQIPKGGVDDGLAENQMIQGATQGGIGKRHMVVKYNEID